MKRKSRNFPFLVVLIVFLLSSAIMGQMYKVGKNRPPVIYSEIPQSTIDWLRNINDKLGQLTDQGIVFVSNGPYNWDNDEDPGVVEQQWSKIEDSNFIVYYKKDSHHVWEKRARDARLWADEAIIPLSNLMGKYYYPKDVNGRKLAIYLCDSQDTYNSLASTLLGQKFSGGAGNTGVTIQQVGPNGCLTRGILINSSVYSGLFPPEEAKRTLWHEMNHYVFFSSIDYGKQIHHFQWVSEGLANYFGNQSDPQITDPTKISFIDRYCFLDREFPTQSDNPNDAPPQYWAGESFFKFLEQYSQGKIGVAKFIGTLYENSTTQAIKNQFHGRDGHRLWVNSLRNAVASYNNQPADSVANGI